MIDSDYKAQRIKEKKALLSKLIRNYKDLIEYWSGKRSIMKSERLNQSHEFIAEQLEHAKLRCDEYTASLASL